MTKKILTLTLAVLALVALLYGAGTVVKKWLGGELGKLERKMEEVDRKANETIAAKEAENAKLLEENAGWRAKDAAGEVEKKALRKEIAAVREDLETALEEIRTAPPETLLAKVREYLGTDEIDLRKNSAAELEAVFTIPAFRLDAGALEEWKSFKFELVPRLEREVKVADEQLFAVRAERDNLTVVVANKDVALSEKDNQLGARDEVIRAQKKKNLIKDVLHFLAGLGTGLLASLFK